MPRPKKKTPPQIIPGEIAHQTVRKKKKTWLPTKPQATKLHAVITGQMSPAEVQDMKIKVLQLLADGVDDTGYPILTATDAARSLGFKPYRVYQWLSNDPEFRSAIDLCRQVAADRIEGEFYMHDNFIPKMMILKGIRPMYRDNFQVRVDDSHLNELLTELKALSTAPANPEPAPLAITEGDKDGTAGTD